MRLTDLKPQFIKFELRDEQKLIHNVDSMADAQGIRFLCPKCFEENKGNVGTHSVICWSRSRGIGEDVEPLPGRWTLEGSGYSDLTLNGDAIGGGGARSVLLLGGCNWHGFITNGEISWTLLHYQAAIY